MVDPGGRLHRPVRADAGLDRRRVGAARRSGDELGVSAAGLQWVMNGYLLVIAAAGGHRRAAWRHVRAPDGVHDRAGRLRGWLGALRGRLERGRDHRRSRGPGDRGCGDAAAVAVDRVRRLPGGATRPRALGIWAAISALALAIGPLIGGLLVDLDWRLIFWINVPVLAFGAAVMLAVVPETRDETATHHLDIAGLRRPRPGTDRDRAAVDRVGGMGPRFGSHHRRARPGSGAARRFLGGRAPGRPAHRRLPAVSQRALLRRQRGRLRAGRRLLEPDVLPAHVPAGLARLLGHGDRAPDPPGDGSHGRDLPARRKADRPVRRPRA